MSKPVKRKCPQCGVVKSFRADCKTCGCPRPVRTVDSAPSAPDPLVGKCFIGPDNKTGNGNVVAGHIQARIGPMYLVRRRDDPFDGEERLVPLASMAGWSFGDDKWLQGFEEVVAALAVPA
jgi:hypothetical protein